MRQKKGHATILAKRKANERFGKRTKPSPEEWRRLSAVAAIQPRVDRASVPE